MKTKEDLSKNLMNYCEKDYTHHHCWLRVGVDKGYIIYQCFQCRKCAVEEIRIIGNLIEAIEK
jgi:hypothetical protein